MSEQFSGNSEQAVGRWVSENLSAAELEALRTLHGPFAVFRRGEPLALMPLIFLR